MRGRILCEYGIMSANTANPLQAVIMLCPLWQAKIEAFLDYYCQSVSENGTDFHHLSLPHTLNTLFCCYR